MRGLIRIGLAALLAISFNATAADKRVALVIGNSAYQHAPALPNPSNDAQDISATLRKLGFKVNMGTDLSRSAMEKLMRQFGESAVGADTALIFYSGHGVEIDGINYLIPIDASLRTEQDAAFEAVSLDVALRMAESARRLRVVILDACRNNPMAQKMRRIDGTRAIGGGLAPVEPVADTLVAYSTKAGRTASDGVGRNSPFTAALINAIQTPGLEISLMFRKVRDLVLTATNREQEPFVYGSLGGDLFYFAPPVPGASQPAVEDPALVELAFWKAIKDRSDTKSFDDYLSRYPQGLFFDLARGRLAQLKAPASTAKIAELEPQRSGALTDRKAGEVFRDCPDCPQMVVLPQKNGAAPLAVARYETTKGEYARFLAGSKYPQPQGCFIYSGGKFQGQVDNSWSNAGFPQIDLDPAVCVSYDDATAYARWLSQKSGKQYRLLRDDEWQYAATGGGTLWGEDTAKQCGFENGADLIAKGQYGKWKTAQCEDGFVFTAPVGRFRPNAFGLYDMLGNASEWVEGCYDEQRDAQGQCALHTMRGGSWYAPPSLVSALSRDRNFGSNRGSITGFRIARSD